MDHTGEILGTSDLNCFDSAPSTSYLKECLNEGLVQKHALNVQVVKMCACVQVSEPSKVMSVAQV